MKAAIFSTKSLADRPVPNHRASHEHELMLPGRA
jgi:hypothetical protein